MVNAILGSNQKAGLYALDVLKTQSDLFRDKTAQLVIVPITRATGQDQLPQARPQKPLLGITPKEVRLGLTNAHSLLATSASGAAGKIIFTSEKDGNSEIYEIQPDGQNRHNLTFTQSDNSLFSASPNGNGKVAFLSNRGSSSVGPGEIYLMDANGSNVQQVTGTQEDNRPAVPLSYPSSLAWSPDGSRMATLMFTMEGTFLAILPSDPNGGIPNHYIRLKQNEYTAPIWLPDGEHILLYSAVMQNDQVDIYSYLFTIDALNTLRFTVETRQTGLERAISVLSAVILPSSNQIALLCTEVNYSDPQVDHNTPTMADIFAADIQSQDWQFITSYVWVPNTSPPQMMAVPGKQQVLVRVDLSADLPNKVAFFLTNTNEIGPIFLTSSEDYVYGQVISPDGRWLLYNTERGAWILDMDKAVAGTGGPALLLDEPISNVDWLP